VKQIPIADLDALAEGRRMFALAAATIERDVRLHELTEDEQNVLVGAVMNAAYRKPPRHKFWGAGEPDCPHEIKASNGELHTLRCKVCGEDSPRDEICRAAISRAQVQP
jgi:hypothetical protein